MPKSLCGAERSEQPYLSTRAEQLTKLDNIPCFKISPLVRKGFSYVEVLLSAVIIAVLLVSAMQLFANLGRSRRSISSQDDAAVLALEMIEEIKQLYYHDPNNPGNFGPETGELGSTRMQFDDIDDYHNWSACPPEARDGQVDSRYQDYTRAVRVGLVAADDFTETTASDEGFKAVTITLLRDGEIVVDHTYVMAHVHDQEQ